MSKFFESIFVESVKSQDQAYDLMESLIDVAQPGAVYAEPVSAGDYTVITASEVSVGLGFGWGTGGGFDNASGEVERTNADDTAGGFGNGGGGGGNSIARPVAAISIGPDGVKVDPIVDITKVVMAFLTAFGAMWVMFGKMRNQR